MTAHRLSGLDLAFLSLERDITPLQLGALAVFRAERPATARQVAAVLAGRVRDVPRLRRTLRRSWFPPGSASWIDDPRFDPGEHIHVHHLDADRLHDGAADLAARLMAGPLPRHRPLWELHVMSGADRHRFAVLTRLHHAFADGLGALEIGLGLLDEASSADTARRGTGSGAAAEARPPGWRPADAVRRLATAATGAAGEAGEVLGMAGSVLRSVRLPTPGSPLMTTSSGSRALALARMDLRQVRRIRRRHGGTANDVMLAVVSGALRAWLSDRGHPVDGWDPRALIPVSSRARAGGHASGNQLSGYLCELPVGEPDPARRVRALRHRMERSKAAGSRRGPGAIPLLADMLPGALHRLTGPAAGQAATLLFDILVTSVPVPGVPMHLAGAALDEIFPVPPLAASHALSIALSTYRGAVFVGLHADREAMPDIDGLAKAIPAAADALET